MKWVIALSVLATLGTAASSLGVAFWTGHLGHRDPNLRSIHYDTQYDLSAQRRNPPRQGVE
jgi:hypothetical protein